MEIRNVLSSVYKNDDPVKKSSGKSPDVTKKDKIEISKQAMAMQNTEETKNLADIQKKIDSGFYNSDEVLSKVADSILKEIGK
jgi:anti-sigma28 factor (negative regulator of flagellin synthesis)